MDWKKEIKLGDLVGRKSDAAEGATATVAPPDDADEAAPEAQKTPFWKKELRIGKASDQAATPSAPGGPPAPTKQPSRYARPGTAPPERMVKGEGRRSRFTRPGSSKPDPAEKKQGKSFFSRSKSDAPEETDGKAGKRSLFARRSADPSTKERKSRFSRPGAAKSETGSATAEPRTRGRSPLAREISFSFKRRPKEASADEGAPPAAAKQQRGKKGEIVGLKVGASHVSAAHVSNNGDVELLQLVREPIERGIVVGGELRDANALGAALGDFFRRNKLPQKSVRLGIGTNRIGVRRLEITGLQDRAHLENAIRFRAQEVLPIPLEEAVLDYQVVGETTDDKGNTTWRVLLVVAYRDLVQRYVQACRAAGLKLVGIDLEAFALLRALGPEPVENPDDAAVVIVSIGHDRSTFVVADGSTCEFARVLDWGGGSLDVALARALDRTPSQVEAIKHSLTLNATAERLDGFTPEEATTVYEAVRNELQSFVRELVSSLHFYQNQPGSLGIGEITITGGTAQLPGLAAELQRLIGVTVRVGNPLARVSTSKRVDTGAELGSLAVAIGLGLEG